MRMLTGQDRDVIEFVLIHQLPNHLPAVFKSLEVFNYYIQEGKTNLAISIGCTGGQHRSVVLADYVAERLKRMGYSVLTRHRDVQNINWRINGYWYK